MSQNALTYFPGESQDALSIHDRVQIALAIAEPDLLKSLLVNCTPALAHPDRLGMVTASIGVPVESRQVADGVIAYETVHCVLADSPAAIEEQIAARTEPKLLRREFLKLTRCESETYTLGKNLTLAQAIALLEHAGFGPEAVADIINIPTEAWHKSWWYTLDSAGNFSVPFLRLMRTLRFPDGSFTLQYKDYFAQDKPTCFTRHQHKVLIEIKAAAHSFRKTLERINLARAHLGIQQALLICDRLSPLEAQGFMSQGISVYTAQELVLHTHSDCSLCINSDCPLNGQEDSPVLMCKRFCIDALPQD